ncbi:MAG: sulfotransferase [Planktothrix rubescens PR222]
MRFITKVDFNKNIEASDQFCKFGFDPVPHIIEEHLKLSGWVIGIESPAVGVEFIQDGQLVGEALLTIHRPRAAKIYATFPGAEHTGFIVDIPLENINCELGKISIQAVLEDFKRIPLADLNLSTAEESNQDLAEVQAEFHNTREELERLQSQFDEVLAELEETHLQLHQIKQTQSEKAISTNLEEKMNPENTSAKHNKVFGIGLSKTATASLIQAMRILGYKSKHYLLNPDVDILEHEFLGDMPIQTRYKEYDKKYPGSKFILTVRDQKSWLRSCMNHFRSPVRNKNSLQYKYRIEQTGIDGYDEDVFSKTYDQHIESIKEYFKQREGDLLILDICGGEGWGQLCAFLGKEIPKQPFPKIHVSKNKSSVVAQAVIKQEPHPVGEIAEDRTLEHQELRSEKILLCAIAKNEAAYLVEWIAYHKFIVGFDEVLIYENDSTDNSRLILEKLDKLGICQYKPWPRSQGIVPQRSAYNDAIQTYNQSYQWVCFLDLDEFLVLKSFNTIQDCIQSFDGKADSIVINWLMFGSSGHSTYSPEPVIQRFTKCADYSSPIHKHMKSISKIDSIEFLDIHIPRLKPNSKYFHINGKELHFGADPTGEHIKNQGYVNHKPARINHYQSKSLEEYQCRKLKGRATVDERSPQSHLKPGDFDRMNSYCNQIENLDILATISTLNDKIDFIYQSLEEKEVYPEQFKTFIQSEAARYDSLVKNSTPINKATMPKISKIPLWAPEAVGKISEFLMGRPKAKILEFGSGGSTIWLSSYDVDLISIEHDQTWFSALQSKLEEQKISNVSLLYREKPYFKIADEFPDHHFDLILVDGRDRNECIQASLKKVKNGGLLVLDDAQRTRYRMGRNLLEAFPSARYYHPHRYTQIWSIRHDLNYRNLAVDNPFGNPLKTVSSKAQTQEQLPKPKQAVSTGNPRENERFLYYKTLLINLVDIPNKKGLEIGAFDRPFITPREGQIDYSDYRNTEELKQLAKSAVGHDPKFVVDVTYDLKQISLSDIPQKYDYIIASHVLEHTPNMIGFLNNIAHLLADNGFAFLMIPDKRYTFDCLKPVTTLGELLENHFNSLDKPSFRQVFNGSYYNRPINASDVWSGKIQDSQSLARVPRDLKEIISKALQSKESYIDSHCNIFTDVHFEDVISELIQGGLLNFSKAEVHKIQPGFLDFLCILHK